MLKHSDSRPCDYHCVTPSRKHFFHKKPPVTKNLGRWVTENQQYYGRYWEYQNKKIRGAGWMPVYSAQVEAQSTQSSSTHLWVMGAGDGGTFASACCQPRQIPQNIYHDDCSDRNPAEIQAQQACHCRCSKPKPCQCGGCYESYEASRDSLRFGGQCRAAQRARHRGRFIPSRTDSGLGEPSRAMLNVRDTSTCNGPFSCLPWQQQVAQVTLEERGDSSLYSSRFAL